MNALVRALVVFLLLVSSNVSGRAQTSGIVIAGVTAEASFPEGITFRVSASSNQPIVNAELLYTRSGEQTLRLESAPISPSKELEHALELDLFNTFMPPGIEISYRWRLTAENGDTAETESRSIEWVDSRFEWREHSTDQVSVYSYAGNDAFSQTILDTAQATIDRLQTEFGLDRSNNIRIWVYDSGSDFEGAQIPNSEEWVVGTAYPAFGLILAVLPEGADSEVARVIPHEISHQVLHQAARNPFNSPPLWFDEGLAGFAQLTGTDHMPALVESAAEEGRLLSLRSLTAEYPYDSADVHLAYAESLLVVRFIIERWGLDGIGAIIDTYRSGVTHNDAFTTALGVDIDELDRLWRESLADLGEHGVAVGTSDSESGSGLNNVLINGSAILLVFASCASALVMARRIRSLKQYVDDPDSELHVA